MEEQIPQHSPKKKTTGKVFREAYNLERIERLKQIIRDFYKQGQKKLYSILVDGEMVVSKNSDSRNFDHYKRYLLGNTKSVEVRMYFGNSPNCNRHIFQMGQTALSGINPEEVEARIKEALAKQRIEQELISLRKQLKKKNKKLEAFKALQLELDEKQLDIKDIIDKGMEMYRTFQQSKVPSTGLEGTTGEQTKVEVQVESNSQADHHYNKMKKNYTESELLQALRTWEIFTKHPELNKTFTSIVNQKIKKNGNT